MLPKIAALRKRIDRTALPIDLEVDGGVGPQTARRVVEAGARVLVAGNAVFGKPDRKKAIADIRVAIGTE
jgi:ribulose-phosphate 3-epimerase